VSWENSEAARREQSGGSGHDRRTRLLRGVPRAPLRAQLPSSRAPSLRAGRAASKDWFRIENLSADEASIYIFDEIGMWGTSAQGFVDQLNAVTSPKITVYLNSPVVRSSTASPSTRRSP
jgi:hypothetical protein